jgi:sulfide:quinone oxidoreductase
MATTTLILGGGTGGIVTANTLRGLLPKEHRIIVVDKSPSFTLGATKPWVMVGERTVKQLQHPRSALKRKGIEVVQAEILRFDAAKREVVAGRNTLHGDYMVLALGADYHMGAVEGLEKAAHTFYTLDGASRLHDALKTFTGGEVVILIPRAPFKCPPAPYEGALLLHNYFRKRGLLEKVRMAVYTVEGAPMATAGPEIGQFVRGLLSERQIAYHPQKRTKSVDPERKRILFEDGSEAAFDLLIAVPPHEAPKVVRESGLTGPSGWIPANPKTLEVTGPGAAPQVYAIGDVTTVPLPGRFKPDAPLVLPKAGAFAEGEARVVAAHIAARVLGREAPAAYEGKGFCYIETGDLHAVRGDGDFFAMPHPTMSRRTPDMMQYEDKLSWVAQWLKANL